MARCTCTTVLGNDNICILLAPPHLPRQVIQEGVDEVTAELAYKNKSNVGSLQFILRWTPAAG